MKRRIYNKEELSEVFRINSDRELERLWRGLGWRVVDCVDNHTGGYCLVRHKGSIVSYHAIVWILTNGTITDDDAEIDHMNGDKLDNRIENLRLVSNRENQQNTHKHRAGRLSGCCFRKDCNKWQARIEINGRIIHLGYYDTELEAHQTYCKACGVVTQYVDNKQFRDLVKKGI